MVQELVSLTPWTMIFSIVNLLITVLIVKKLLFKPVMNILAQRQQEIDTIYSDADQAKSDAADLKAQYTEKLSNAREEADTIVRNAVQNAERKGDEIVTQAKDQAVYMKQKAEAEIEQEKRKAFQDVKNELSGIAVDIAAKVVSREIDEKDHVQLVEDFIKNVGENS
ncbi:MAG: F0F1 ATP synthase subunit B [Clostridia bacterium]|nr:F0F1 ATP synthase subunit B [Clostridia bacterium]MDO4356229.1 F0F1 ATP synthase subunit B [Clostridia bacterium]